MKLRFTFHVTFSFIYYESVASATPSFVTDDSHPFNRPIAFEISSKVSFGRIFILIRVFLLANMTREGIFDSRLQVVQ